MVALRSAAIPMCTDPTSPMVTGSVHSGPRSANSGTRRPTQPAGHRHAQVAGAQSGGGVSDRVDARGAEPVDRHAWDPLTPIGQQRRGARDVRTLFVDLRGASHDHVLDRLRLQTGPVDRARSKCTSRSVAVRPCSAPWPTPYPVGCT